LNSRSDGGNFSSTSGQPEIVQEKKEEHRFDRPIQYLKNRSHGENFSSTSGQAELVAEKREELRLACLFNI
jgi:hypothetical protein